MKLRPDRSPAATLPRVCVVCGHALDGAGQVRTASVHLYRCAECEAWSSHPRVEASRQAARHDSEQYFEHPYLRRRREQFERADARCREVFERLSCAVDIGSLRGQRLLDVGCDTGQFLACAARRFGIRPVGVDVAARAVEIAAAAGIEAYHTTMEDAPARLAGFPVITAIDVIEHVADPARFLRDIRGRLAGGGAAYVETPNIRSAVYSLGRALCGVARGRPEAVFRRLFPPEHVQYFTAASLRRLAADAGLEMVRLGRRTLPTRDIAVGLPVRAALGLIQAADRLAGREILIWAVLRAPAPGNGARP